ncbi:hypothetical protein Bbelb_034500 [Branchiostoma belcheri]|nr:hypothetical protein Bbelb_034500 [Branchiostoma belcheri]
MAAEHGAGEISAKHSSLEDDKRLGSYTTSMWDLTMFLCVLRDLSAILCSCSWGTCVSVCILGGSACVSEGPSVISKRQENIGLDLRSLGSHLEDRETKVSGLETVIGLVDRASQNFPETNLVQAPAPRQGVASIAEVNLDAILTTTTHSPDKNTS